MVFQSDARRLHVCSAMGPEISAGDAHRHDWGCGAQWLAVLQSAEGVLSAAGYRTHSWDGDRRARHFIPVDGREDAKLRKDRDGRSGCGHDGRLYGRKYGAQTGTIFRNAETAGAARRLSETTFLGRVPLRVRR